ncbi:MAG TPA: PGPGW domain-containing protein [Gaiellaceae bacterium]
MANDDHRLVQRLQAWRERHLGRGAIYRVAFAAAGFLVLAAGVAMLVLPGPGMLVTAIGLAMLALEFAWAERLLTRAIHRVERARDNARGANAGLPGALAVAAAALSLAAILLWDVPLLPV